MKRQKINIIFFIILVIFLFRGAQGNTWFVTADGNGDAPAIQDAINLASDGDTILVADGLYTGEANKNLNFNGKLILLKSENGPAECIIDCENDGRGMIFENGEDNNAVVDGFTIRNGNGDDIGGGILIYSSPVVRNMILTDNQAVMVGGAIMCYGSPLISNCTIVNNQAGGGSAIFAFAQNQLVTLDNCIMAFNSGGPAISGDTPANVIFNCCNVYGNPAGDWPNDMGDSAGNMSLNPIFCDYTGNDFSLDTFSPCAPDHPLNLCGKLFGALETACQNCVDIDYDGLCYEVDNCPNNYNPDQTDVDNDGIGDICDGYVGADTAYISADVTPLIFNKLIRVNRQFRVNIIMNNNDALRTGIQLPFVFYSPNQSITEVEQIDLGAGYGNIEPLSGFESDIFWDFGTQINGWSWDGSLPDSIRFIGSGVDNGWPAGLGEKIYLQFGFKINQLGLFCIDSINCPFGDWLWDPEPTPAFNGPYCWRVVDMRAECGDLNGDGATNIFDITFLINYLYFQMEMPASNSSRDYDVNGDEIVNIHDIIYLIDFLYTNGPGPVCQ